MAPAVGVYAMLGGYVTMLGNIMLDGYIMRLRRGQMTPGQRVHDGSGPLAPKAAGRTFCMRHD